MAGKRKNLFERKKIPIYIMLIGIVMMGFLVSMWGVTSGAEDTTGTTMTGNTGYYFSIGTENYQDNGKYQLKTIEQEIGIKDSFGNNVESVEWSLTTGTENYVKYKAGGNEETRVENKTATIIAKGICNDSAFKPTIQATFKDKNNSEITLNLEIEVVLRINDTDNAYFRQALKTDEQKSLFLTTNTTISGSAIGINHTARLKTFITNDSMDYSWESENADVLTIDSDTGFATAVGAGKTRISVTAGNQTATIDAYVLPKMVKVGENIASDLGSVGAGEYAKNIAVHSGDFLTTNVYLKTSEKLTDKISWSIQKDSENGAIIADSKGKTSDLISLTEGGMGENKITINAKAGNYVLKVYPVKDYETWYVSDNTDSNKPFSVKPTTITVTVYPEFSKKSVSMNVDDQFHLLDALNITSDNIGDYTVSLGKGLDGTDAKPESLQKNDNDYLSIDSNYVVTAKQETGSNEYVQVEITPKGVTFEDTNVTSIVLYFRFIDAVLLNVSDVSLNMGDTMELSSALSTIGTLGNYYLPEDYQWSSSNDKYVSVDEKGKITALQLTNSLPGGCAVITVKLKMPSGITKVSTCNVYVKQTVTKIVLDHSEMELIAGGDTEILTATFNASTENAKIRWLSSDEKQTYVQMEQLTDNTVSLKGMSPGSAVITVLNEENMVTAICKVNVVRKVNSITIPDEMSVNINRGYVKLDAVINPADASDSSLIWKSSNKAIVDVEDDTGLFRLISPGTVTVSVWYKNDPTVNALCKLTVTAGSDSITIDEKASVEVGQKLTLNSIITPVTAETNTYWYSTNEKIASVNEKTGEITGVSVGTTYIIAVTDEGHTDKCELTVTQRASGISFPQEEITVAKGSTLALAYELTPKDATVTPTWKSFNEDIVSVNQDGVITANEVGETYVSVTIPEGYTASIMIKVIDKSTGIQLSQEEYNVTVGTTALIGYTLVPDNATTTLTWRSLDETVATVKDGVITGVKVGSTYIVVTSADGYSATCKVKVSQFATGITLESSQYVIEMGNTQKIGYTLMPADGSAALTWKCLDETVARVDDQGVVTAVGVGNTFVVVTSSMGYSATCSIVVTQQPSSMTFSKNEVTVNVGETYAIEYTLLPANSTIQTVTWTTQNAGIATVDETGKITGVAKGTTFIIASLPNGYVAYLNVVVKEAVKGVTLDTTEKTIVKGESFTLKPVFTPVEPSNKNITWTSSNEKVAKVSSAGKVTGVSGGVAIITGKTEDGGYTVICTVTVTEKVTKISLNHSSYRLVKGKAVKLKATVTSNTATTKKVKWSSSKKTVATVTSTGRVKGKKVGTCVIKATTTDGTKKSARCTIRVIRRVSSLQINKTYARVMQGKTLTLKTKITPSKASIKRLTWSSSDEAIATVTSKGKVTGITPGTCTITAKTTDGSNLKVICNLVVYAEVPSTDISITASDITMVVGKTQSAGVTVNPTNTTDKIRYSSDRPSVATVSSKGKIKAIRPGTATITVSTSSGQEAYIGVTVVGLNKTSLILEQYDSDELWVEGIDSGVKWSSSNPAIARVENGTVVARKVGTCVITASVDGVKLNCYVKVKPIR